MTTPPTTDPVYFHDSYFIRGKDHQGNERYYRMRLFEVHMENGKEVRKQVSLTLNEWQQQASLVQQATTDFFARPVALPDSFKIDMQNGWKLTPAGHPESSHDLLSADDQIARMNFLFAHTLGHKRLTATLLSIPPLPVDMQNLDDSDLGPIQRTAPVGIRNMTGKDCFISAFLQAFVFTNPELMRKLWAQRTDGKGAEIGRFLYQYFQAQIQLPGSNGEVPAVDGVHQLRQSITRSNETTMDFLTGAHDPIEAFAFIVDLLEDSIEQDGLPMRGYIQVAPQGNDSLEECIHRSLSNHEPKQPLPQRVMVANNTKNPFASVVGSCGDYDLTSFIQHDPKDGGRYIAYVQRNGVYYKCNDSAVEVIEEAKFLEEAKTARAALYTRR